MQLNACVSNAGGRGPSTQSTTATAAAAADADTRVGDKAKLMVSKGPSGRMSHSTKERVPPATAAAAAAALDHTALAALMVPSLCTLADLHS